MEALRFKPRQPEEHEVEDWDDGDFVVERDDLTFRSASTSTNQPPRRRDSNCSRLSFRSDLESWNDEEEQHVHLPGDDEKSTMDALAAAETAGIPLPKNVPSSALTGGTIRRLGAKKVRRIVMEDWGDDMELPETSQGLKFKQPEADFPEMLRQVSAESSVHTSPVKPRKPIDPQENRRESGQSINSILSGPANLDKFKDNDDDDDVFGEPQGTVKASKGPTLIKPAAFITPPTPQKVQTTKDVNDDFEADLQLPSDGKLKLSTRRDIPKTPSSQADDLDWGEGSLGTRFGGTRRDGRSNRSSSASALSPSVSSSMTIESEDETFEGLVLPEGPVNFKQRLQQRRKSRSPERVTEEPESPQKELQTPGAESDRQDFLDGLDLGDGKTFDAGKLTLHRNVRLRETRPASPARPKVATSLTFSNKPQVQTRIPRLSHERAHSSSLEPVSESGETVPQRPRRGPSRLGQHTPQSSITSIPTPTASPGPSASPPTPRRRDLGGKASLNSLRGDAPTTTSAQLLKQKRSLPAIRALNSKPSSFRLDRPPSRGDGHRPQAGLRPKTPVDRQRSGLTESPATQARKPALPFSSQSTRSTRHFRRHDSDNSIEFRPNSRAGSRSTVRSPSPQKYKVAADTWERLSKPKNKRHFGDGHELDGFDDLPTSRDAETKYTKQPSSAGPKPALRNKTFQNVLPNRNSTPSPSLPYSPSRTTQTPHFARDTTASRIARETSLAQRPPSTGPLAPVNAQRMMQPSSKANINMNPQSLAQNSLRAKRSKKNVQTKPHLISNLGGNKESKVMNGMFYNPDTFRWEGNENALNAFDPPVSTPASTATTSQLSREKEASTPRPALITNFSATKGVQVVGGMVFDPQSMCWLKLGTPASGAPKSDASDPLNDFNAIDDDEDVFRDIPDLEEKPADDEGAGAGRVSDIQDDWLVGEEFDVGPEFVRRQREEEERWRKKCEKWVGHGGRERETWRWTIRELVSQFDDLPM